MSYISAEDVLPKELIETIQRYVSGKSIYIPCKEKKLWGSQTKTKQYYKMGNQEICIKHKNGVSVKHLPLYIPYLKRAYKESFEQL